MSNSSANAFDYYTGNAKEDMHFSHIVALVLIAVSILTLCLFILKMIYSCKMRHDRNLGIGLYQARADV